MIVLGISGGLTHDPAACLLIDGILIGMTEEERFVRKKHALRCFPINAIVWCLNKGGIVLSDVDIIACSWNPKLDPDDIFMKEFIFNLENNSVFKKHIVPPVNYLDHHICHAAAAFFFSELKSASVLIVDGSGENYSTSLGQVKEGEFNFFRNIDISDSLGHFYRRVTRFLDLGHAAEGKLMGLAPYGKPQFDFPIELTSESYSIPIIPRFETTPPLKRYDLIKSSWENWLETKFGESANSRHDWSMKSSSLDSTLILSEQHKDIAASAQKYLEDVILHLVGIVTRETSNKNLVFGGGVALNCGVNSKIARSGLVDSLTIFPGSHDAGGAFGAAMLVAHRNGDKLSKIGHVFHGRSFSQSQINSLLDDVGASYKLHSAEKLIKYVSRKISDGKVIGWFQGQSEFGPRALGHRSILSRTYPVFQRDRINKMVKYREDWRPLAPSLPWEVASDYFVDPFESPYMLHFFSIKENKHKDLSAVVHIDGTSRPQFVTREKDSLYYELLLSVGEYTGVPAMINTSLNTKDEPIVDSPIDALKAFATSSIDILVIGEAVIEK